MENEEATLKEVIDFLKAKKPWYDGLHKWLPTVVLLITLLVMFYGPIREWGTRLKVVEYILWDEMPEAKKYMDNPYKYKE